MLKFALPFSVSSERARQITNIIGVVIVAWLLAGIAGQAVASLLDGPAAGAAKKGRKPTPNQAARQALFNKAVQRSDYEIIIKRNIFDSTNRIANRKLDIDKPKIVKRDFDDGPPKLSKLPVKLLGTVVSSNEALSSATISGSGRGATEQYRVGDKIQNKAEIYAIERNRVYIRNNGRREYLETDFAKSVAALAPSISSPAPAAPGDGIKETAPGKYSVDRGRVEQVMANMSQVMTQARVVPHFENGKAAGWKIFAIKPNSIYQELNLKNGDIIQRINGQDIDSPAKALEMYQTLSSESRVAIDLIRKGTKQSFEYEIR